VFVPNVGTGGIIMAAVGAGAFVDGAFVDVCARSAQALNAVIEIKASVKKIRFMIFICVGFTLGLINY
jgi:hypothetical protein